jgi:hypothetical protein
MNTPPPETNGLRIRPARRCRRRPRRGRLADDVVDVNGSTFYGQNGNDQVIHNSGTCYGGSGSDVVGDPEPFDVVGDPDPYSCEFEPECVWGTYGGYFYGERGADLVTYNYGVFDGGRGTDTYWYNFGGLVKVPWGPIRRRRARQGQWATGVQVVREMARRLRDIGGGRVP